MDGAVSVDGEVLAKAGVLHVGAGVPADVEAQTLEEAMVVVEVEVVLGALDAAVVDGGLTVFLADVLLDVGQLERTNRALGELDVADKRLDLVVVDRCRTRLDVAEVLPAAPAHQAAEVLDVHRSAQALADEQRAAADLFGYAAIGEDVGEVELSAVGEHAPDFVEDGLLVGGEVDNAVGDDDVDGAVLDAELVECLDVALLELDVVITPLLGHLGVVCLGDGELIGVHVDADDLAGRADELGC